MYFLRCHIGCGEVTRQHGVHRLATGEGANTRARSCLWQVFFLDEPFELRISRGELFCNDDSRRGFKLSS